MVKSNKSDFQENRNTQSFTENRDKGQENQRFNSIRHLQRAAKPVWRGFSADQVFGLGRFPANI
jgi:hypothetical protein